MGDGMNEDDEKVLIDLKNLAAWLKDFISVTANRMVVNAADLIERLMAENAALTAELKEAKEDYDELDEFLYESNYRLEKALQKAGESPDRLANLGTRVDEVCLALEAIPQLKADVKRLTPKPLMIHEIVDALNAGEFLGATDWGCHIDDEIDRPYFTPDLSLHVRLELREAQIVAQGLLRDAGPIVAREPAKGEDDV